MEAIMRLQFAGGIYDRTVALITGAVQPEGVELDYLVGEINQIFRRMLSQQEFEASELSASNFIIQRTRGDERFVALPVFPSRTFRHNAIYVNVGAGIERPEDLRGKRVGIPEYFQTANFWIRAFLQHDYGVLPEQIRWVRGDPDKLDLPLPANLELTEAPGGRAALSGMLEAGDLDALVELFPPACFRAGSPRVRRLFPDCRAAEIEYYQRTGHFPIMHLVALRRDVYERDRTLAWRLYDAFLEAKRQAYSHLQSTGALVTSLPLQVSYAAETRALFGDDPFPYGVERNRHTMGALARYVYEQGVAPRELSVEEIFVPELLNT
jgi:4,5-dihydroxyphthalate decarboxylase